MTDKLLAALAAINTVQTREQETERDALSSRLDVLIEEIKGKESQLVDVANKITGRALRRILRKSSSPNWGNCVTIGLGMWTGGEPLERVEVVVSLYGSDIEITHKFHASTDDDVAAGVRRLQAVIDAWNAVPRSPTADAPQSGGG